MEESSSPAYAVLELADKADFKNTLEFTKEVIQIANYFALKRKF